jgi:hypothetical protein
MVLPSSPAGSTATFTATLPTALEARNPLVAVYATGSGNKLPAEQSGISISRKGALVTAFGENPDGDGTLLRVWEQAGVSGGVTVTLGAPGDSPGFASATPDNLRGEKTGVAVAVKDGKFSFKLDAYAPASFVLAKE